MAISYEDILFFQDEAANEYLDMINEHGEEHTLNVLKDYHYPGEHMTRETESHGKMDNVFEKDNYILSWNPMIGYVGLEYILEHNK